MLNAVNLYGHDYADVTEMIAVFLDEYVKMRAVVEGFDYELSPEFFLHGLQAGALVFFGVVLDPVELYPMRDNQEPFPGFFDEFVDSFFDAELMCCPIDAGR